MHRLARKQYITLQQGRRPSTRKVMKMGKASRNMVIGTTLFPHKDIHRITWGSPDAHHFSQIGHLLIDSRHVSHLMDVITHRCANHFLLVLRIRARISNAKKFLGKKVENIIMKKLLYQRNKLRIKKT